MCDFTHKSMHLHRSKVSIQRDTNIQQANLTVQRLPSKYYGVSQETEGATRYIFPWLSPDYDLYECEGNAMCGYGNNVL